MRNGLIAAIAAIVVALGIGALLASWGGQGDQIAAGQTTPAPSEGRAATGERLTPPLAPNRSEPAPPTPR